MRHYRRRAKQHRKKTLAKKVAFLAKIVRGNKPEIKWSEATANGASFNYNGSISQPLTGISQGYTDYNQRVGDSLTVKSMKIQMYFTMSGTTTGQINRVIVFQIKHNPDGAIGVASYINLVLHSTDVGTSFAPLALYDHDNRDSYRILHDSSFVMNYSSSPGTSASNNTQFHRKFINVKIPAVGRTIEYYNAGTTITKNEICILVISNSSTNQNYSYTCQTLYGDN